MESGNQTSNIHTAVGRHFDETSAVFDTFYDDQRGALMRWVDRRFRRDMFVRFDLTLQAFGDLSGRSVLDIGCGSGPYSVTCAQRGVHRVVGLDLAEGMLTLARRRAERMSLGHICEFQRGCFPQDTPGEVFDHGIVMGVMDYVADPLAFLQALSGCIRMVAAVSFPSVHWFRSPLRRLRYRLKRCPLYLYREAQVEELMAASGFGQYTVHKIPGAGMDFVAIGRKGQGG